MYCTYLTVYYGNQLPPYYIGCVNLKKIGKGYNGTIKSKEYHKIWKRERKLHPHLFKTFIIKVFEDPYEAGKYEKYLHDFFKVTKNPMFINKSSANSYGHTTKLKPYNTERAKSNYETNKKKILRNFRSNQVKGKETNGVTNSIWINNGEKSLRIDSTLISYYLDNGYSLGRIKFSRVSTYYMNKDGVTIRVQKNEIESKIKEGFSLGYTEETLKKKRSLATNLSKNKRQGKRIWFTNEKNEIQLLETDHVPMGYKRGRLK